MKNKLNRKLDESLKAKEWEDFLSINKNNPLLENAHQLSPYFRTYASARLVGVIPALSIEDPLANSYFSAPSLDDSLRIAPAFLFDNSKLIKEYGNKLFDLIDKKPNYFNLHKDGNVLFLFDTEDRNLHIYGDKGYSVSPFFEDMKKHIMEHPYALIFKGCDDGHVGMRFKSQVDAHNFLSSLTVFEDVFKYSDDIQKTLIVMKKENPLQDLSELFKNNLEYHN